jgi:tetratricopeptide (TPR) repeat protein
MIDQFLANGQSEQAASLAAVCIGNFPHDGAPWKGRCVALSRLGQDREALAAAQQAATLLPDDASAQALLGFCLLRLERVAEAAAPYQAAVALAPSNSDFRMKLGWILMQERQFGAAREHFAHAASLNPMLTDAHLNAGNASFEAGQLAEAEAHYRKALGTAPNSVGAICNLSTTLLRLGRHADAEQFMLSALQRQPAIVQLHVQLGALALGSKRLAEAEQHYRRALALAPADASINFELGNILSSTGNDIDATDCYRTVVATQPGHADAWNNLGNALLHQEQLDAALDAYQRTDLLQPGTARTLHNLAYLHHYLGNAALEQSNYEAAWRSDHNFVGLSAAAMSAVGLYLAGQRSACQQRLAESEAILGHTTGGMHMPRAYWILLNHLLKLPLPPAQAGTGALAVVGESHALSLHGRQLAEGGRLLDCSTHWILGCKQWHLANPHSNRYKRRFEHLLAALPPRSTVLLTIGEIDCRSDEGILKAWRDAPFTSLETRCNDISRDFLAYAAGIAGRHGHTLIASAVPAPNLRPGALPPEEMVLLAKVVRLFNAALRSNAAAAGIDLADVYTLTANADGMANGSWHLDEHHLRPEAMAAAFQSHYLRHAS